MSFRGDVAGFSRRFFVAVTSLRDVCTAAAVASRRLAKCDFQVWKLERTSYVVICQVWKRESTFYVCEGNEDLGEQGAPQIL